MDPSSSRKEDDKAGPGELTKGGDGENDMNGVLEGPLMKFTSILKGGFQQRWFQLDPLSGTLTYYLSQEALKKKSSRGQIYLPGAQISPSEEDSQTFSINAASGDIFKLRALDAKERQLWVSHLRHAVEAHQAKRSLSVSPHPSQSSLRHPNAAGMSSRSATLTSTGTRRGRSGAQTATDGASGAPLNSTISAPSINERKPKSRESSPTSSMRKRSRDPKKFSTPSVHSSPSTTQVPQAAPAEDIGPLNPINQACLVASHQEHEIRALLSQYTKQLRTLASVDVHADPNVLMLKATAQANLTTLQQCLAMLTEYQQRLKSQGKNLDISRFESEFPLLHMPIAQPVNQTDASSTQSYSFSHQSSVSDDTAGASGSSSAATLSPKESGTSVASTQSDGASKKTESKASGEKDTASEDKKSESVDTVQGDGDDLLDDDDLYSNECGRLMRQQSVSSLMEKENRVNILQLCSRLKLGMDLTTVTFPVSLLEGRSVLELCADLFSHTQLFMHIGEAKTPCQRMVAVVRQYVCAFHTAFQHQPVRKPYNAQLGEMFKCDLESPLRRTASVSTKADSEPQSNDRIHFVAEQVSHHPPVSAFHLSCPNRGLFLTADITCKSKFLGMSAAVGITGQGCLKVSALNEDYTFTFPSLYCRSIITNPWMEFNGRVRITCEQTGYQAIITFPAKPSYGQEFNKFSAEIRSQSGSTPACKISGRWDGLLTTTHDTGETEVMDVTHLANGKKLVQPMRKQAPLESRRLWRRVTAAIRQGDYKAASAHKQLLEDAQRAGQQKRQSSGNEWKPVNFEKVGDRWKYRTLTRATSV